MKPDRIDRPEARRLAEEEFERFAKLAAVLTPDEWTLPTDCSAWDVRKIALHVLGSADAQASVAEFAHQLLESGRPLGLAGDMFDDRGIGEHRKPTAISRQPSAYPDRRFPV